MAITEDNKKVYMLAYGTLRNKQYNFNRINQLFSDKEDGLKYIRTIKIPGYKMYDLGQYPFCIFTGTRSDIITCDIIELSEVALNIINNMEVGAGYTHYSLPIVFKHEFKEREENMSIYIFENTEPEVALVMSKGEVTEGDWVKHIVLKYN